MILLLSACNMATPFSGPGVVDGELAVEHEGPFWVAATYAKPLREHEDTFADHVDAIVGQLDDTPGLVGYSLRGDLLGRDNWTMTVWESEEEMLAFTITGAHAEALGDYDLLEEASFTRWEEPDASALPPEWDVALDRLAED